MTELLKQAIGAQVRAARDGKGWNQDELASRIGKASESVSNIERGVHLPALDTLIDLARELDLDIMQMIEAAHTGRKLTQERARQEAEIAVTVRGLSDTAVAIAAEQIAVLVRLK